MSEPCNGCHGSNTGCACGCCEGTAPLTPLDTSNRPGLDAIQVRVGTHSSFLETMRARLSSQELPALAGLTTREANDPALALLDAWATVADVLTFYQERIANEGYLRTATERRSVRELARLVGYELRPGVAASTWLAFTLDPGPEVVIPAGARAQSVPAPGELPQPFETSRDLTARAAWNNLQIRLTRPQLPQEVLQAGELYFKGIATNLKPNDPLLIKTEAAPNARPRLYRVKQVDPDAVAGRTRVTFEPWLVEAPPDDIVIFSASLEDAAAPTAAPFREIAERAADPERSGVSLSGTTAKRVLAALEPLRAADETTAAGLRAVAAEEVLPKLREEHRLAVEGRFTRLEPWIGNLVADLENAGASEPALATAAAQPTTLTEETLAGDTAIEGRVSFTDNAPPPAIAILENHEVLDGLGKKPSKPPADPLLLDKDLVSALDPKSDTAARLLLATRPELRKTLYKAWGNLPVSTRPTLEVWALRLRASIFGHNAPLELVRRERDGVITGTKEWDLIRGPATAREDFSLRLLMSFEGQDLIFFTLDLRIGNHPETRHDLGPVEGEDVPAEIPVVYAPTNERVLVRVLAIPGQGFPQQLAIQIVFERRGRTVDVVGFGPGEGMGSLSISSAPGLAIVTTRSFQSFPPQEIEITGLFLETGAGGTDEQEKVAVLDTTYPSIIPGSWIALERPSPIDGSRLVITRVTEVAERARAAYGLSAKATHATLADRWLRLSQATSELPDNFSVIRGTAVYAQSELLELAEMPIRDELCGGTLELADLYDGLEPGRWLIVSGERTDLKVPSPDDRNKKISIPGIPAAELVMVAGVRQGVQEERVVSSLWRDEVFQPRPGERTHTTLELAEDLAYCYRRDTLVVWGNVAPATHGETRSEILGSGRASEPWQRFTLKQAPLTHVSARTPTGIESTLRVRVNDVLWHEAPSLFGLTPTDHVYTTRTGDDGHTEVVFGDGRWGARVPTGSNNLHALYRSGIGAPGNLDDGRITQLVTRPLGVKDVTNPLPATGGADPESRDQAKRNAPLAVMALDRLVSVQDYADFARTFAGVGRAVATRISDGRSQLVHVTIAGEDDIPIASTSELLGNLAAALRRFGDPHLRVEVAVRELALLVISAGVRLHPDYLWEAVAPRIRAALLDALGFARRDLAEDALLSEAVRAIHTVPGVDYVDVDLFDRVTAAPDFQLKSRIRARSARTEKGQVLPAQLVYLTPAVPDTVILKELKA